MKCFQLATATAVLWTTPTISSETTVGKQQQQQPRDLYHDDYRQQLNRFKRYVHAPVAATIPNYGVYVPLESFFRHDDAKGRQNKYQTSPKGSRGKRTKGRTGRKRRDRKRWGYFPKSKFPKSKPPFVAPPPLAPPPVAPPTGIPVVQCDVLLPCPIAGQICDAGTCVADGNPRFTLQWEGDDDLDFNVTTPSGVSVLFGSFPDPTTGCTFENDSAGSSRNNNIYIENVFCPVIMANVTGVYTLTVTQFRAEPADDFFRISVYEDSTLQAEFFGVFRSTNDHYGLRSQRFQYTVS